jgi:hypothetical protein
MRPAAAVRKCSHRERRRKTDVQRQKRFMNPSHPNNRIIRLLFIMTPDSSSRQQ